MEKPRTLQALTYQSEVTHLCPLKIKIRNELLSFNALILEKDAPDYGPELILGGRMTRLIKDIPPQRGATQGRGGFQNRGGFRGRGNGFRGRGNGQNKRWPPAPGKRFGRVTVPNEQNRQVNAAYECDYEAYENEQYDDDEDNPDVCVLQAADSTSHKKRFEERKQKYAQYLAAESESDSVDAEDGSPNPKRTAARSGEEFEPREESDSEADENHMNHRSRSRRRTPSAHRHRASIETDFAPPSTTTSVPTTIPLEVIAPVTETRHSGASDGATQKTTSSADSMIARPGSVVQVRARPCIEIVQKGKRGIDYEVEQARCDKLHTIRPQSAPSREENQLLADRAQHEDWPVAFLGSKWIALRASRAIAPLERQALNRGTTEVVTITQNRICWVNPLQPHEVHCTLYRKPCSRSSSGRRADRSLMTALTSTPNKRTTRTQSRDRLHAQSMVHPHTRAQSTTRRTIPELEPPWSESTSEREEQRETEAVTSDSIEQISPAELNETLHDEQPQSQPPVGEILTFVVSGKGTRVLFDSGATHSIVSKAWLDQRGIAYTKRTTRDKELPEKLIGVGKSVIYLIGTVVLALDDIPFPFYVCDEGPSFPIIGTPEMQQYGIIIDFAKLRVTGANGRIAWELQPQAEKTGIRQFEASIKNIKFIMYASGKTQPPRAKVTQVAANSEKTEEAYTAQAKSNPENFEINKGQSDGGDQAQPTNDKEIESQIETTKPEVKIQLREVLKELSNKFSTAFNEKLGEPTKLPAHLHYTVELMNDVNSKYRKQDQFNVPAYPEGPPADEKALRETIEDLIKQGILEPTFDPVCTSPVRIVPNMAKKENQQNGGWYATIKN